MNGTWMKIRALILTCLACLLAARAHAGSRKVARELYYEGLEQYRRGEFKDALSSFSNSLTEYLQFMPAQAARAQVRHALGDKVGMERDLERALRGARVKDAETYCARANARFLSGDVRGAIADYSDALERDPEYADALVGRGRARAASDRVEEAISDLKRAIKTDPNHLIGRYHLAKVYYDSGQKAAAKKELTRILNGNRNFAMAYGLLGVIFAESGDTKRALAAYSKGIRLFPEFTFAYIGRALVYIKLGRNRLADKDFESAIRNDPSGYAPYYNRGEVRQRRGDGETAMSDFRVTLKLEVPDFNAAYRMGDRFFKADLFDESARMYTKALLAAEKLPETRAAGARGDAYLMRSMAYEKLGSFKEALEDLDAAVAISSSSPRLWTARGKLLLRLDRDKEAEKDFAQAIAIDAKYAPALVARGTLMLKWRRFEEALNDFDGAIKVAPQHADAYNSRGVVHAQAFEDFDKAVLDFAKAVSLDRGESKYRLNLGVGRIRQGRYWDAIESLTHALKLKASPARVHMHRAEAYYNLGDVVTARKEIEEGLKADPRSSELYAMLGLFRLRSRAAPQAIRDLEEAVSLDGRNAKAFLYRGMAYGALGEYRRAISDLREASKLDEKPLQALTTLCHARRMYKQPKRALDACNDALALDAEFTPALIQRGFSYMAVGDYARASRDLSEADRMGPAAPQVLLALSISHAVLRQYKQSDRAYREAMGIDFMIKTADITMGEDTGPQWDYNARILALEDQLDKDGDDPYTYVVRGNALHNAGHFDRAILEYTRAMEYDGKLTAAYLGRASALEAQDSLDAAEQDLRRAVQLSPDDPLAYSALVTLLTARGKFAEGLKFSIEALKKQADSPQPDAYVKAGNLRYFMKKVGMAADNYKYAIKFSPVYAAAYNGLGLCDFAGRDYKSAIQNFSRAIELHPDYDRYFRNRASAYVNLGQFENAAADYKLALAVNRDSEMIPEYQRLIENSVARIEGRHAAKNAPK